MSCLPQLFLRTRSHSHNLAPNKVGGQFSINLRSAYFSGSKNKESGNTTTRKLFISSDNKRYKSWMDGQKSFNKTKRSSRSYFHKDRENRDITVQENNIGCENTNGQINMQSQLEVISNFHVVRKNAIQTLHLASKTIEMVAVEECNIKQQLKTLKQKLNTQIDEFNDHFQQKMTTLIKQFKKQRKESIKDTKTLSQQSTYLQQQFTLSRKVTQQQQFRFSSITAQFY